MDRVRLVSSASATRRALGVLGIVVAVGCAASSGNPHATDDGGSSSRDGETEAAALVTCNPLLNNLCPHGLTCCFYGLEGTCEPTAECTGPYQVGCSSRANCDDNQFCCGSGTGRTFSIGCQATCAVEQFQLCMSNEECEVGKMCLPIAPPVPIKACLTPYTPPTFDASPGGDLTDATTPDTGN
jgi:hypothetical protein